MPKKYAPVPRVSEFMLKKKETFTEPPWVYLEREMKEKAEKGIKPYNQKVGDWLKFLKELKEHFKNERKENLRKMNEDGPPWFIQFTPAGLEQAANMGTYVHHDVMSNTYEFSLAALRKMGISIKFPESMLETAVRESGEDPGVFLWTLFTLYYKTPPSEPLRKYNTNAKLLMSAIMFVDFPGCIKKLAQLTDRFVHPPKPAPKKTKPNYKPNVKFGEYLAKEYVPCNSKRPTKRKHPKVDYKLKIWEEPGFEKLAQQNTETSLHKRRQRFENEKPPVYVCKYKFWEPPIGARLTDPKEKEYIGLLMKVFKNKPKLPPKLPIENIQCHIGTVSYTGNKPQFQLHNFTSIPTGYIIHNGGAVKWDTDYVINILGHIKYPKDIPQKCLEGCKCIDKWPVVQKHLAKANCKCRHRYDFNNKPIDGQPATKYFKPPTKYGPYTIDEHAIADIGSKQQLIETLVESALKSVSPVPSSSVEHDLNNIAPKVILMSLLADLMDSPLLIPHLPKAYMLPNAQAWIRKRIKGSIGPKLKSQLELKTKRGWMYLNRMDFRVRAHRIPYSVETMPKYDFSHRYLIQKIREREFEKLAEKTKQNMLLQSRLLWATMRYDDFPMKGFLRTYCAYMPHPEKKVLIYAPVKTMTSKKGRTCNILERPGTAI